MILRGVYCSVNIHPAAIALVNQIMLDKCCRSKLGQRTERDASKIVTLWKIFSENTPVDYSFKRWGRNDVNMSIAVIMQLYSST